MRFLDHIQFGTSPPDERSARRRDLYLTTHNSHKDFIHAPGGIRTRNPSVRAKALDRAATGTGSINIYFTEFN